MNILECMGLMDFIVYVVEGVCYGVEIYKVFARVALMQPDSSTVAWCCGNHVSDLI